MPRLYLVRHGEPAGTFTDSRDPGLSPLGHAQAKAAAEQLRAFGPLDVISSPLMRARETSAPYEAMSHAHVKICKDVAEIPTPAHVAFEKRGEWLRGVMMGKWSEAEPELQVWRDSVVSFMQELPRNTVIFSHYVAINVAVAAARKDDRVTVCAPTHCSITILDATPSALIEIELGRQGESVVR